MLKVTCKVSNDVLIPFNYKYMINSCLYSLLEKENMELFDLYHNNKKMIKGKPLKPFVFSNLKMPDKQIFNNIGYLICNDFYFYLNSSNKLVYKIFKEKLNKVTIGNTIFDTKIVEEEDKVNKDIYISLSPVVIGIKENGFQKYLSPIEPNYIDKVKENLKRKYFYVFNEELNTDFQIDILTYDKEGTLEYYKNHYIKAYNMIVKIKCEDCEVNKNIKIVLLLNGIGSCNSMGFGMLMPYDKEVIH